MCGGHTDHHERPMSIDDLALCQRSAVGINDPEESGHSRLGVHLAANMDVLFTVEGLGGITSYFWCV